MSTHRKAIQPASPNRRKPKQQRAIATVEAVLDAAVRILKREGASSLTTNRIAEVAGVSIGSVYQYFPDKAAIFSALHRRHVQEIDAVIERTLVAHASSPLPTWVAAIVDAMLDAHATDPVLYQALMERVTHRTADTGEFPLRMHAPFRLALASRTHEIGRRRNLDRTAFVVVHMVDALTHGILLRRPRALSVDEARRETIAAILDYLRPPTRSISG